MPANGISTSAQSVVEGNTKATYVHGGVAGLGSAMDGFAEFLSIIASLLILDALAVRFGVDSRKIAGNDWTRPISS